MTSHEDKVTELFKNEKKSFKEDRLNIATLKYFWQSSPLVSDKLNKIPKFLRKVKVFDHFSDFELQKFSKFLHQRFFHDNEVVFKQGDSGFGFYLIFSGSVEILAKKTKLVENEAKTSHNLVVLLSKGEYFGELSLLEKQNKRNGSAVSKGDSTFLAIYKPDIEELIEKYPVIGAKFLQGISIIVANRFNSVTLELRAVKEKLIDLERQIENQKP